MKSDVPLDYAVFQLSPRRSRCQLFVSHDGATEKLASGLVKPFIAHLKVAEERIASAAKSIKLEVERDKEPEKWFTKGTLERFVRFVSTPEVLELVSTSDAEMSQLESARKIYSQGPSDGSGGDGATTASEATKKELLRAIDVRLLAVGQDLSAACTRASAAGFNPSTVSELQLFADQFGAHRLSQACTKFLSLFQKRPEFSSIWKSGVDDRGLRSSSGSDMSVDDLENDSKNGSVLNQHQSSHPDELRFDTRRPVDKPSFTPPLHPSSRETSVEKEESNDRSKEKEDKLSATTDSKSSSATSGPFKRQLSVQDRISLFENKQKENSPSTSVSKPAVGKSVELRKQPSDVSSAGPVGLEKAVLRRWSGAGDIGIDPTKERKEVDSGGSTPTSAAAPTNPDTTTATEDKGGKGSVDAASSLKLQSIDNGLKNQADLKKGDVESLPVKPKLRVGSTLASQSVENAGRKDQICGVVQSNASFGGREVSVSQNERTFLAFQGKMEQFASRVQMALQESAASFSSGEDWSSDEKDPDALNSSVDIETYHDTAEQVDVGLVNQHLPELQLRTFKRAVVDLSSGSAPLPFTSPPVFSKSTAGEVDKQYESSSVKVEDSGTRSIKFPRHASPTVHAKKSKSRGDDGGSDTSLSGVAGEITADNLEPLSSVSPTLPEQAQRVRQSKGNQGLNSELKMKANELEKLFAEHKLRVPGDQSSATRRSKPVEVQQKNEAISMHKSSSSKPSSTSSQLASKKMAPEPFQSGTTNKLNASPVIQPLEAQDNETTPKQNVYSLRFSSEPKGKFYNKYMQKRDAKLKEEWTLRRPEKEARLKAMHDSLERSSSEMKTKLAWSVDRLDVARRAERLRSFNARSASRKEQPIHSFLNDEDEDQAEYEQDGLDLSYRSTQTNRTSGTDATSSTSRASPASRLLPKSSASSGGRRKSQNPLAPSVPSFSDYRKENTKSSSGSSKGTGRPLVRNHSRSKSSCEDVLSFKEEKPLQPHHSRKGSNPAEQYDLSFPSSGSFGHEDELSRSMDALPFSRKGNTYGISRSKATFSAVTLENEDEELVDTAKGVDYEYIAVEERSNKDITNPRGSEGSVRSVNSGYENGDALGVSSRANPASLPEMPAALPSAFRSMVSVLDSPGEGPGSWNSCVHNPFSFQHEASDFDASVDSPVGSPAYWNQPELDAARMRKKWGAAQKPNIVADSSHGQPRKDLAKGLKRFLKFGRKNRGADNLADWVSVTTSEGDDDTEDGRDPANRSSDDLRKSRMGFPQYHPSDDGFSETDSFSEQGAKSFFSLSTFRSKGSDSKPR